MKLKSTSFYSQASLVTHIPLIPSAYDSEDDARAYFIIGQTGASGGLVSAPAISINNFNANAKANVNNWSAPGYMPVFSMTPSSFAGYVRARKEYKSISSLGSIDSDGIYLWAGSEPLTIDEAAKSRFDSYRVVLVSSGTVNVLGPKGLWRPLGSVERS